MMQGLGHFHRGDHAAAVSRFVRVLELDVDHEAARYWLARAFIEADMSDHARIELEEYVRRYSDDPRVVDLRQRLKLLGKQDEFEG